MAQELVALAALAEDLSFVTSTYTMAHSLSFRESEALFQPPYACVHMHITKHIYVCVCIHIYKYTRTHIYINLKGKKKKRITFAFLGIS